MVVRADAPEFKDLARTTKSSFLLWLCAHSSGHPQYANDRHLGEATLGAVPVHVSRVLFFITIGVALGAGIT
jgi:hypothetical protein